MSNSSQMIPASQLKFANAPPWLVLLFWIAFWLLPGTAVTRLALEDGLIENLGAVAFFVGATFFLAAFLHSRGAGNDFYVLRTDRNLFLLLLAVAFFFAAGEEISWGQRLFGWETPASLARLNEQNETTIHNLAFFQHGKSFSFWFNVFWLGFCVGVPVLDRWRPAHDFFGRLELPVVSMWMGILLLANYAAFKLSASPYPSGSELRHAANELKESSIALIFVWIAWSLFEGERAAKRAR